MELVCLPENTNLENLEDLVVVEAFNVTGVKVKKRDFHAIHRLTNKKSSLLNLLTEGMPSTYSETKNPRELNQNNKNKLKLTKIYVNESLCPYYRKLLGKCNSLLKKNRLKSFYTINGKLKIKYDSDSG